MVAKIFGLATGALVASVAVWGFNSWRHVSDEDRIMTALTDHCLPYVLTGETPFDGLGRSVGVYDNVDLDDRVSRGGATLIFDARFVATWGEVEEVSLRICRLEGRPMGASVQAFDISSDGFATRVGDAVQVLGDLQQDQERLDGDNTPDRLFQTLGWFEVDMPQDRGNRVVMSVADGKITDMIVIRDLAE